MRSSAASDVYKRQVTNEQILEVEDLVARRRQRAHASRLRLLRSKDFQVAELLKLQAECLEQAAYDLERVVDIAEAGDSEALLQIEWTGLPGPEGRAWVSLSSLSEDAPDLLRAYIDSLPASKLKDRALASI